MRQIRKSIFETNSSSTHSVVIKHRDFNHEDSLSAFVKEDGNLHVKFGEFGWGYDEFDGPYTKLSYLLTMVAEIGKRDTNDPKFKSLDEFYLLDDFILVESIVCEHLKCGGIHIDDDGISANEYDYGFEKPGQKYIYVEMNGHIDHQSCEDYTCLADFLEAWNTNIEDFIFNRDVILVIDNDNN